VPFPDTITYSLGAGDLNDPAATLTRVDDYTLQLDITATKASYNYGINSIKVPFSQIQDTAI